jgi:capsular exopolysaccharide synthesis family protein
VNLTEHFRLIWRRKWIILALSAVIAAAVYARSRGLESVYKSTATLDVISSSTRGDRAITADEVAIRTSRYAALSDSSSVLRAAVDTSGLDITVATARNRVSSAVPIDSKGFITVTATGPSPRDANALADGVVGALRATGDRELNPIDVVSGPATPSGPASPTPSRDALLAFLIALIVNSELFALIGFVSGRLPRGAEPEEVARLAGVPVLALIPDQREAWAAEAFRTLRAGIDLARAEPPVRSIAIVGAEPGSGTSFVALGLAEATANLQMGVVLVDANLRRPVLASELHVPEKPGLVEALRKGTVDLDDLPEPNPVRKRFRVLPAGVEVDDPPGVLGSGALRKALDQLNGADQVVVDSPATTESIDAVVIAAQCDAAILVIDAQRARRRAIENAVLRVSQANVQLLGTVINRITPDERTEPPSRARHSPRPAPRRARRSPATPRR